MAARILLTLTVGRPMWLIAFGATVAIRGGHAVADHAVSCGYAFMGTWPQIYTVCHVWTFDFQLFLNVRFANFQHKSQ